MASQEETLLEALIRQRIEIDHSCGGNGTCGTCLVQVVEGNTSDRNEIEQEMSTERKFKTNERLACQLVNFQGCVIKKGLE